MSAKPAPEPAAEPIAAPAPEPDGDAPFDARRFLTQISGRDYLEVKWRLLWLRTLHPAAEVLTELVRDDGAIAVFRALVTLPGGGSASGWGSESVQDFGDYLEKAETKALGRALAALGFGTQFAVADYEDGAAGGRPVDNPVEPRRPRQASPAGDGATERQLAAVYAIGRAAGLADAQIVARCHEAFGLRPEALTRRDASTFIDVLKAHGAADRPTAPAALPPIATIPVVRPPAPPPMPAPMSQERADFERRYDESQPATAAEPVAASTDERDAVAAAGHPDAAFGGDDLPEPIGNPPIAPGDTRPSRDEVARFRAARDACYQAGSWDDAKLANWIKGVYRKERMSELTAVQLAELTGILEEEMQAVAVLPHRAMVGATA